MTFLVPNHVGGEVLPILLSIVDESLNLRVVGSMASVHRGFTKHMSVYAASSLPPILGPLVPLDVDPPS